MMIATSSICTAPGPNPAVSRARGGCSQDTLEILIELSSSDIRIGAVNDALDLAYLGTPLGLKITLCGVIDAALADLAATRGIRILRRRSRTFSRLGLPFYALSVLLWMIRLRRLRPDIVHLNYAGYGPSLACAGRLCRIPVVGRAGGEYLASNPSNRWIDAYVANCGPHAQSLLDSPLAGRVVITGDLFRRERLQTPADPRRPLPPRREGRPRFVFLGQLVPRKGISVLVEAFAMALIDADLLLVGGDWDEGGYPSQVRDRIEQLGVGDRIRLENHRTDASAVLIESDVLVLPSLSDARPRCILEAMFLGRPVIATSVGGIPTMVEDGVTGCLVRPGDPVALSDALRRLADSPELRRCLGQAGRARAEAEFQPERTAGRYAALYRRLAGMDRRVAHDEGARSSPTEIGSFP
jgi:glycosyltransferase involved in cell wall biosynthesis